VGFVILCEWIIILLHELVVCSGRTHIAPILGEYNGGLFKVLQRGIEAIVAIKRGLAIETDVALILLRVVASVARFRGD
jgi:hypothetical protein